MAPGRPAGRVEVSYGQSPAEGVLRREPPIPSGDRGSLSPQPHPSGSEAGPQERSTQPAPEVGPGRAQWSRPHGAPGPGVLAGNWDESSTGSRHITLKI